MKHSYKQITLFLSLIFQFFLCFAEGFSAGTLVKIPDGYAQIEDLRVGDSVLCYDAQKSIVASSVVYVAKKSVDCYARIILADECLCVACDQQLYDENNKTWIVSQSLSNNADITIEVINKPIDLYLISVAQHHNFFVTKADICAHNFIPLILAVSAAFGLGSVELTGISFGVAGLGTFLGYQWHKKNKQKHNITIQPQFYGGGMEPEDPEGEKKRKRDEARESYRPLTNKEARAKAKELGYRETKNHPCGNTYDKPVFTNGKEFISPDKYGHKGGVWKVFDKSGTRVETTNIDLTIIIGK